MASSKRPGGVTFIAILVIFSAVIGMLTSFFGTGIFSGAGFWLMVLSLVQLIVGIALLQMQKWAWSLAIVVTILRIIGDTISVFSGDVGYYVVSLMVQAIVLWYLYQPHVRKAFENSKR